MNADRYPFEELASHIIECVLVVHNTFGGRVS